MFAKTNGSTVRLIHPDAFVIFIADYFSAAMIAKGQMNRLLVKHSYDINAIYCLIFHNNFC